MVEKLDAGRAIKAITATLHEWLKDLEVPTEDALENIGKIVDEWRQNHGPKQNP